jgi:hypothetical protein
MEAQPAPIGAGNALRFPEESDEQNEHEISIDLGLKLEVAREIFRSYFAPPVLKLQRSVERVIDFFDKHNERPDILIAQAGARIMTFELVD